MLSFVLSISSVINSFVKEAPNAYLFTFQYNFPAIFVILVSCVTAL